MTRPEDQLTTRREVIRDIDRHEDTWRGVVSQIQGEKKRTAKDIANRSKWGPRLVMPGAVAGITAGLVAPNLLSAALDKRGYKGLGAAASILTPATAFGGALYGGIGGYRLGDKIDDSPQRDALREHLSNLSSYGRQAKSIQKDRFANPETEGFRQEIMGYLRSKEAELKTPLLPHQQRVVDRIQREDQPGLVVVHGLGSGKTLTSIAAQEALGMPSSVVVPAALQDNYAKERKKHLTGHSEKANISSLQRASTAGSVPSNPLMVVDEAHRARDPSSKTYKALQNNDAEKRLLLSASPFYNHPADLSSLVNLAAGTRVLPPDQTSFTQRFIREVPANPSFIEKYLKGVTPGMVQELNPRGAGYLKDTYGKWVDYHPGSTDNFPQVKRTNVEVPMTKEQLKVYDAMVGAAPAWVAAKIRSGLPPSKREAGELNTFMNAARQVSNTTAGFAPNELAQQPKIDRAFADLQQHLKDNQRGKALIYSNYLESGINPYKAKLQAAGIPFGEFTGDIDKKTRDQLVRDYNEDKIKALLVSSAGGEGLDLKGTRLVQMLDPHWNNEKLRQVEGRAIRYKSHDHLPEEERNVTINNYLATRPRKGILESLHIKDPGLGADQYLTRRSGEKDKLIEQFKGLLPNSKKS